MKILYITHYNSEDYRVCSGTIKHVKDMLQNQGHEVKVIDKLKIPLIYKFIYFCLLKVFGKKSLIERHPYVLNSFKRQIQNKVRAIGEFDLVFSPSSLYFSKLEFTKPTCFYTDAVFGGMVDYYLDRSEYFKFDFAFGFAQENNSIRKTDMIILASEWARKGAVEYHYANLNECFVANRGANIRRSINKEEVHNLISNKVNDFERNTISFLFLGGDWERKGGVIAIETVYLLNVKYGFNVVLDIVGCEPDLEDKYLKYARIHGYLNKNNHEEYGVLESIFKRTVFFILPTRREAQGISYTEACSWGVPVVGCDTGGVSDIINNEKNGLLFATNESPTEYAKTLALYLESFDEYKSLAESTYSFFYENLTWESVGTRINSYLVELVRAKSDVI